MKNAARQLLLDLLRSKGQDGSKAETRARARVIRSLALPAEVEAEREAIQEAFLDFNALAQAERLPEAARALRQRDRAWGAGEAPVALTSEQAREALEVIDRLFPVDAGCSERLAEAMDELSDLKERR